MLDPQSDEPTAELPAASAVQGADSGHFSASLGPDANPLLERAGDRIGPYRLLEVIGEGGFGVVWLAERREPMVQRVALKVVKPGMDTRSVVARFELERQALAVMDHPNVARVLDAGATPSGRPFFVMEHVKGESITVFADRHRLTIRQRLELFLPACEAVQHAHQKGIIHRDVKPSNILVAPAGEGHPPLVKVIDFGVAKAISRTLAEKTIFTEQGQIIGTPEYMSPEQAEMGALDVDTRTDVYSLGVVLYELLSGTLPFDSKTLRSAGYAEIQRIIREVDPPRPSTRLSTVDEQKCAAIARARQAGRERLATELRQELEWIPMRALRKDRAERYRSASELADDVRNWLSGRPLIAVPESTAYRARKFVRRHRRSVAAGLAIAVSLVAGTIASILGWSAAATQRDVALLRERETRAVLDFLESQLSEVAQEQAGIALFDEIERRAGAALDAGGASPGDRERATAQLVATLQLVNPTDVAYALVRAEMLARAETKADLDLAATPLLRASVLMTLARVATQLAEHERAASLVRKALGIRTGLLGIDDPATLEARDLLLRIPLDGDRKTLLAEAAAVLDARRAALGEASPEVRESMRTIATIHADFEELQEAERWHSEVSVRSDAADPGSVEAIRDLLSLGEIHRRLGRLEESERSLRAALERLERQAGGTPRLRAEVLNNLGLTLTSHAADSPRFEAGIAALREVHRIDQTIDGIAHPRSFESASSLGIRLGARDGSAAEAGRILQRSWAEARNLRFQPNAALSAMNDYANWFFEHGALEIADPADRARELRRNLELVAWIRGVLRARASGVEHGGQRDGRLTDVTYSLAMKHLALAEPAEAEPLLAEVVATRLAQGFPAGHFVTQAPRRDLALAVASQGRWQEAIDMLAALQADAERDSPETSEGRWVTACRLLRFLEQWRANGGGDGLADRIARQEQVLDRLRQAHRKAGLSFSIDVPSHAVRRPD